MAGRRNWLHGALGNVPCPALPTTHSPCPHLLSFACLAPRRPQRTRPAAAAAAAALCEAGLPRGPLLLRPPHPLPCHLPLAPPPAGAPEAGAQVGAAAAQGKQREERAWGAVACGCPVAAFLLLVAADPDGGDGSNAASCPFQLSTAPSPPASALLSWSTWCSVRACPWTAPSWRMPCCARTL